MSERAYAVILNDGYLYFPIKRDDLDYGGMPQFFGGAKMPGESDRECITREMSEESDHQLALGPGGLYLVHKAVVGADRFRFYVATVWEGKLATGPLNNQEMQSIARFFVDEGGKDTVEDLCRNLGIVPTEEFVNSETYEAFNRALIWSSPPAAAVARAVAEPEPA